MLGAIIGDVVGSRFEFHNIKTKKFEIFSPQCYFTDDTVMTCAVADSLLSSNGRNIIKKMKEKARLYPNAGYGSYFFQWVLGNDNRPYYSCGNGSAMRVSSVGWVAKTEEEVKELSRRVTEVTHNHPEGLKGAEVTAMCVFKALHGATKEELKEYMISQYPQITNLDYDELVKNYKHEYEICQVTLPQALYCFLISNSFEDCLRTTISIGGDCDTTSAISCAIAEAYYGIPKTFKKEILKYFGWKERHDLLAPVDKLYKKLGFKDYFNI